MKKQFLFLLAACTLATFQLSAQWSGLNTATWTGDNPGNAVDWNGVKGTQVVGDAAGNCYMTIQGNNSANHPWSQ